jgi:phosphatidate cytidylyltransferase
MAPVLSPNKTWAGFAGSVASCGLALVILLMAGHYLKPWLDTHIGLENNDFGAVFLAGCLFGAVGQAGDLFISLYKRRAGAKDSGTLIPGHGGLLDRIDALLLVTPVFLAVLVLWKML